MKTKPTSMPDNVCLDPSAQMGGDTSTGEWPSELHGTMSSAIAVDPNIAGTKEYGAADLGIVAAPRLKVLVLYLHDKQERVLAIEDLLRAIEPAVAGKIGSGQNFVHPPGVGGGGGANRRALARLTGRELEVLALVAEGRTNKEIAVRLAVSVRTIGTYCARLMRRLRVHSVAGLTKFAIKNGLASLDGGDGPHPFETAGDLSNHFVAV